MTQTASIPRFPDLPPGELIYLSAPFGGDPWNLDLAQRRLRWFHQHSPWGIRVQCPWIPIARSQIAIAKSSSEILDPSIDIGAVSNQLWMDGGGIAIETRVLDGHGAILCTTPPSLMAPGMKRECLYMARSDKPIVVPAWSETDVLWDNNWPTHHGFEIWPTPLAMADLSGNLVVEWACQGSDSVFDGNWNEQLCSATGYVEITAQYMSDAMKKTSALESLPDLAELEPPPDLRELTNKAYQQVTEEVILRVIRSQHQRHAEFFVDESSYIIIEPSKPSESKNAH